MQQHQGKKYTITYKEVQSWILHSKYINWRARKPNYQRRVKYLLQGVRVSTVSNTSGKAVLSQILQLLNQKLKLTMNHNVTGRIIKMRKLLDFCGTRMKNLLLL